MSKIENKTPSIFAFGRFEIIFTMQRLDSKKSINAGNVDAVLLNACKTGYLALVNLIIKNWYVTNLDDCLITASTKPRLKIVRLLHKGGANIQAKNNEAIKSAAKHGHLDIVQYLHQNGARHYNGFYLAAESGHLAVVQYLYQNGYNMNDVLNYAIELASESGYLEVVKFLHNVGAECHQAIKSAVEYGHVEIVKYLYNHACKSNWSHLMLAAIRNGHLEIVRFLYGVGADIKARRDEFLLLACEMGHLDVVRFLYAKGCRYLNPNACLRSAAKKGHLDVVRYLYAQGMDICNITTSHSKVAEYITTKKWLHQVVSQLQRLAAKIYVTHYDHLPTDDVIPTSVHEILIATQA